MPIGTGKCDNVDKFKREKFVSLLGYLSLLIIWSLISTVALVLSLVFSSPVTIGPAGVTVWFVVLLLSLSSDVTLALYTAKTFLHVHTSGARRLRYSWRQGLLIGGGITGVISLSSLNQLNALDAILLALLLGIVEVYVRFRWP